MDGWHYPDTWAVGDKLDADTLNTRIHDQNAVLLRRPITVATYTGGDQTIPTSGHGNYVVQFDTIIQDDDGMCLEDTPVTDFYAQREGSYQVWANGSYINPSSASTYMLCIAINGSTLRYRSQHRMAGFGTAAADTFGNSTSGIVFLNVGDTIEIQTWSQLTGTNLLLKGNNNCPRVAIMWLGPT